jgi:hypothetical protein
MQNLHYLIDSNFSHPDYGRLLQHRDRQNPNILHYSVQLNDRDSLAWEPINSGKEKDTGRLAIWEIDWQRFQVDRTLHQDRQRVRQAMHISVGEFHEQWQYELYRFNCEHWARLVATGDCRCYQIAEVKKLERVPVFGLLIVGIAGVVTGAWEENGYARELIDRAGVEMRA